MVYNSEEVKDPSFIILEDDILKKMVFKKSDGSTLVIPLADITDVEALKSALSGTFVQVPAELEDGQVPVWDATAEEWVGGTAGAEIDLKAVYGISAAATATANTAALNQAITDANAAYVAGLGIRRLRLPPERGISIKRSGVASYSINGAKNGYELFGEGEGRTEFLVEPFDFDNPASYYQSIFHIKGASGSDADLLKDIYLHDFSIDGNRAAMTGTPHANAGDTIDTKWCSSSVITERVTVRNSSSDAFDVDDSTGAIIRFCSAYNASGWGYHNSENNVGTVLIGNYAEGCGFGLNRGGFDQHSTSTKGVYIGNRAKGCYHNFQIDGTQAAFFGNVDLGGATVPNVMTGVSNGIDPVDGKLLLAGTAPGIRLSDWADAAQNKRWLTYVTSELLRFFSNTLAADVLTLSNTGNLGIGSTATGGGRRVIGLGDATVVPAADPTSGTVIYSDGGVLKTRSPAGVIAALVPNVPLVEPSAKEQAFLPTGFQFENYSRNGCSWQPTAPLVSGRMGMYAVYLPADMVLSSLAFYSANTPGASLTNQWFALYDLSRNLLRQTADDGATAWLASTRKSLALSSSYTVPTSGLYYVAIMVAGTTMPNLLGVGAATVTHVTGLAPITSGVSNTGLTTTAPATANALTITSPTPYFTGS